MAGYFLLCYMNVGYNIIAISIENSISSGNDTGAGGLIFVLALTLLVLLLVLKLKGWYYIGDSIYNGISVHVVLWDFINSIGIIKNGISVGTGIDIVGLLLQLVFVLVLEPV